MDTFEEEEPTDIDAVAAQLRALDADMHATNETIAWYCRELNISTPF